MAAGTPLENDKLFRLQADKSRYREAQSDDGLGQVPCKFS